jgi:hypothetical protein
MRKKISTTIYVTPEQADKLKLLHERTKVPVAVYIREGIDLVLRHYTHLLPGQLTLVNANEPSASESRETHETRDTCDTRDTRDTPKPPDVEASTAVQVPVNNVPPSAAVGQK